jgi:hypothetical protein
MSFSKLRDTDRTSNAAMLEQLEAERQAEEKAEAEAMRNRLEAQHRNLFSGTREGFGSNYSSSASLGPLSMGSTFSRQQSQQQQQQQQQQPQQQQQQQQQQYPFALAPPPSSGTRMRASYNMMGHDAPATKPVTHDDLLGMGGKSHRRRAKKAKRSRKARRASRRSRRASRR